MRRLYDSVRWRKASKLFLSNNPLCVFCERMGRLSSANLVDHIIPHENDYNKFWDQSNWQGLCYTCHSGIKRRIDLHGFTSACGVDGLPFDTKHPWAGYGKKED